MAEENIKGNFVHVVFFWLKEPSNEEHRATFLNNLTSYTDNISEIKEKHIGTPADTSRPVVDSTYDYCLITTFASIKEHDIYQEHALHKGFVDSCQHLWDKVQIYDSQML